MQPGGEPRTPGDAASLGRVQGADGAGGRADDGGVGPRPQALPLGVEALQQALQQGQFGRSQEQREPGRQSAAEEAARREELRLAVSFRLQQKLCLEQALQRMLQRSKGESPGL